MKNILWIILENFEPILGGLFFVFLCLLTGQFGWALVIGGDDPRCCCCYCFNLLEGLQKMK